jgi:GT2 family glycosyltransferase
MSHEPLPDVSIVIVSLNTRQYLSRCLAAIPRAADRLRFEVVVVDNGSTDGTQAMLAEAIPQVRLIQSAENLGFGRANNVGAGAGRGRTVLLLNSDCEPQPGSLGKLLAALDQDPSLGGVFCRLLNADGTLQPSVHRAFPTPWTLLGEVFFLSPLRYAIYRHPSLHPWLLGSTIRAHSRAHDVAWGGAACMLIRREVFQTLGGFDERFFMYCEDMDLCKRIRDAGYRLRYLPDAAAIHHWGKSAVQLPSAMLWEAYRSRLYYYEKHFPGWGGAMARRLAMGELWLRQAVFSLLARLPSDHREVWRQRAAASADSLRALRGVQAPPPRPSQRQP